MLLCGAAVALTPSPACAPPRSQTHAHKMTVRMTEADEDEVPTSRVASWYDSGIRLGSAPEQPAKVVAISEMKGVVVPTSSITTPPENDTSAPRAAAWNPKGITEIKFCVPEYLSAAPEYLDGSMPGDVGFDPMCLVGLSTAKSDIFVDVNELSTLGAASARKDRMAAMSTEEVQQAVSWMRAAEIKHGRLAMLAAAGWPISELVNERGLATLTNGRAPSLFNGHLGDSTFFLFLLLASASYVEIATIPGAQADARPGDIGFDPLSLGARTAHPDAKARQEEVQLAEIKHGRVAMMAITGFAVQEFLWGTPVVQQTPWFFGR